MSRSAEEVKDLVSSVTPERFQEVLDVFFSDDLTEEQIEAWIEEQPDSAALSFALLDGVRVQAPAERKAARMGYG